MGKWNNLRQRNLGTGTRIFINKTDWKTIKSNTEKQRQENKIAEDGFRAGKSLLPSIVVLDVPAQLSSKFNNTIKYTLLETWKRFQKKKLQQICILKNYCFHN